jgi:hypothetical protein
MRDVLSAVAAELVVAQEECARLDGALGKLLQAAPSVQETAVMRELLAVDRLKQHVAAMATFLERLSSNAPAEESVEVGAALDAITLSQVAGRLSAGVGYGGGSPQVDGQDIEFF